MKKNSIKSVKTLFTAAACASLLFSFLTGCKNIAEQRPESLIPQSSEKQLISFTFEAAKNPGLTADVEGSKFEAKNKKGQVIYRAVSIIFPLGTQPETVKNLIPTFTASDKAQVDHNGKKLESTKTPSDFYHHLGANFPSNENKITVTAENGETQEYFLFVEIVLPKAETAEVQKYFGSYYGEVDSSYFGKNKVVVVLEENKVTLYSTAMSMDYVNVKWEKDNGEYACIAYKKGKPQFKINGKSSYTFTEEGSKTLVKTNIMGTDTTAEKGIDFVWTEGSEYKDVTLHL